MRSITPHTDLCIYRNTQPLQDIQIQADNSNTTNEAVQELIDSTEVPFHFFITIYFSLISELVFSSTVFLLLLYTHIYSGTLQQGSTNCTPDEIRSGSYTDQLDKAKPARPLNKHHQLLFGLWAPSWTPSKEGKHKADTFPEPSPHRMLLHSVTQLRRREPRQLKPLTCVCESGPHWWRVCSCISMCLNPVGSLYFCFPSHASAHKEMDIHIHTSRRMLLLPKKKKRKKRSQLRLPSMYWQKHTITQYPH